MQRRPNSLVGLTFHYLKIRWTQRWTALCFLGLMGAFTFGVTGADSCNPMFLRVGTFNIENYPNKSADQAKLAFAEMASTGAMVWAVQEIKDTAHFSKQAAANLGSHWKFVHNDPPETFALGVVYNERYLKLVSTKTYPELKIDGKTKPAFEARLRPIWGAKPVRILVVHLASTKERIDIRRKQHQALLPIVKKAKESGEQLIVLGDFNAVTPEDRKLLANLSDQGGLQWSSKDLGCTAYWKSWSGCVGTPLDHVLTSTPVFRIEAAGPCKTEGCGRKLSCPPFHGKVSDHCPVVMDL
jgi:endonuclease/exonuclease/phosphatase family metal-dependent hydrolase